MFVVAPDDIKDFDGLKLVELLRVLLHAEARKSGVPLRSVDAPLQITVADGGQDASVQWQTGAPSTDYFPTRDVVFQCKASDGGDAKWKAEVWTKKSQPTTAKAKVLNDAIKGALDRGGCYIGITATALVGNKAKARADAIKAGIKQAGGDPTKLACVEVYDGNKLAAWASDHPAVAVWVKEQTTGKAYPGLATIDQWGKRAGIASPPFVESEDREFSIGPRPADVLKYSQLAARIVEHLADDRACVRIWGASGIGKTRALYEALRSSAGMIRDLAAANYIFCDFLDGRTDIRAVANSIVKTEKAAVLIVDNCPLEEARSLNDLARGEDSRLRVVTVGADGRNEIPGCLMIRPLPVDARTIEKILSAAMTGADRDAIEYIAKFCDGFPRIAVRVTESVASWRGVLKSADDVAENILAAAKLESETVRALECLSLFDHLEPDNTADAFDRAAETLAHTSGGLMFEHLVIAGEQHLVGRQGGRMVTQPRPIADYLGARRLSYLRTSTVVDFLREAPQSQRSAMLSRWQYLGRSPALVDVARSLLRGRLSASSELLGEEGAPYLVPLVHVAPDETATALAIAVNYTPLDDLADIAVSQELLDALRLLALRGPTFRPAARIVLKLAAVAERDGSPPIVDLLRSLFQVALAGTEATDRERQLVLMDILDEEEDERIARAGVEALAAMLRTHVYRSGDIEQIGSEEFRNEWRPEDGVAISKYFGWALGRLNDVWRNVPSVRSEIEELVAHELRGLLGFEILSEIEAFVRDVVQANGHYFEATKSIGDWLYFDRPEDASNYASAIRDLYDLTLPADPVDQVLLYSRFWAADIHDPDERYSEVKDNLDFEYSARKVRSLAPLIAADAVKLSRAVGIMSSQETNTPFAFAEALVDHVADPLELFRQAVDTLDASDSRKGTSFVRALLTSIDRKLADNEDLLSKLMVMAQDSASLSETIMDIYDALRVTDERLKTVTAHVRDGSISPRRVVTISYGRGLDKIAPSALAPLIDALLDRPEAEGPWAALEILSMYTHEMKVISSEVVALVKKAILAPAMAEGVDGNSGRSDYVHERMLRMLADEGEIDESFARAFGVQIEMACREGRGKYGREVDALRAALATVTKQQPSEIWAVLASFYETATRAEREQLNSITSATKRFAFDVSRIGAGPLFETPKAQLLAWVQPDPEDRLSFLLSFYPILAGQDEDWTWHPALQELADLYGAQKAFRAALRARIFPSSWGGSLRPHLTSFKAPLLAWESETDLGRFASSVLDQIEKWLESDFHR